MFGFGLFTLKSMNLTRAITIRLRRPGVPTAVIRRAGPEVAQADSGTSMGLIQALRAYSSPVKVTTR